MATEDLRVRKTKLTIQKGFAECISKKTFSKLTIQDLTQAMMINKSTFYKYYQDKYDLRDTMVQETLKSFVNYLNVSFLNPSKSDNLAHYRNRLIKILLPIFHHKDWLNILWSTNLELDVFNEMQTKLAQKFKTHILTNDHHDEKFNNLQANLYSASIMQILKWWFYESPTSSVENIADIIIKCLKNSTNINLKETN
ncbi:hypothetical protein OZX56_01895 [Lactobacillus sp. ESL0684]|uniref:TetR/AcrR family transcriptional regulator n=1 Tax=Lactobacillus sp. ESL0684 TaxID=2983213 RepID=UPI0023F8AE49|nr:hypothetical protein [Lactobacillus sp. ESL0684]WEV44008.1 hypothetical protein OZX56_01895 [Lactobacillus sp. ESL0684]